MSAQETWHLTIDELIGAVGGRLKSKVGTEFCGVGTDTRVDLRGRIFFALKGDSFDGHDFLAKAVESGAAVLVVHRWPEGSDAWLDRVSVIEVGDTLHALQSLARFWRRKMTAKILALTGTNGKTTSKEFAATLIGSSRRVQYSQGSFNNHWGVPLTLLGIEPAHEVAIVEMGMNHPGELTELVGIAEPDVVMVTMVGRGHLEGVGSIEGVARAKAEIYQAARAGAQMIFNLENEHTLRMAEIYRSKCGPEGAIYFQGSGSGIRSQNFKADVSLGVLSMTADAMRIGGTIRGESGEVSVPVFGAQNITNLMAASSLALACGLSPEEIWRALPACKTVWGRNQWVKLSRGARVLFDGYNANPESMRAAIENLRLLQVPGRKIAFLAEMKEMGEHAAAVHREIGEFAGAAGFDAIIFCGPSGAAFEAGVKASGFSKTLYISDVYEQGLAPRLLPVLEHGDVVLMKGSRGMALEKALLDLNPIDFQAKKA